MFSFKKALLIFSTFWETENGKLKKLSFWYFTDIDTVWLTGKLRAFSYIITRNFAFGFFFQVTLYHFSGVPLCCINFIALFVSNTNTKQSFAATMPSNILLYSLFLFFRFSNFMCVFFICKRYNRPSKLRNNKNNKFYKHSFIL